MGSRFSLPWGVQKPPAVCKKPPPPLPIPAPPWQDQEYHGLVQWWEPVYGTPVQFSGPLAMIPNPTGVQHTGWVNAPPYQIKLTMTQDPLLPALKFEISLIFCGAPIGIKIAQLPFPQSLDPFDSGLVHFNVASSKDAVRCRVWL